MKKLKRFQLGNLRELNQNEMKHLFGGDHTFTCKTHSECNLYIPSLGITIKGECYYDLSGTSISCYCKHNNYVSDPYKPSACWIQ